MLPKKYRLLGLDVSRVSTGWSIVDIDGDNLKLIDYGFIPTSKLSQYEALISIEKKITTIVEKYKPDHSSIEQMFVGKNAATGMTLARVHGVVLLVLAKHNVPHVYYSIMTAKSQTLGGMKTKKEDGTKKTGKEMKDEVARKIFEIFGVNSFIKAYNDDVTDSISIAYTFYKLKGEEIKKPKNTRKSKKEKSDND